MPKPKHMNLDPRTLIDPREIVPGASPRYIHTLPSGEKAINVDVALREEDQEVPLLQRIQRALHRAMHKRSARAVLHRDLIEEIARLHDVEGCLYPAQYMYFLSERVEFNTMMANMNDKKMRRLMGEAGIAPNPRGHPPVDDDIEY